MKYDAIIIGGGHNGLVTAAFLAKSRRHVLVLEQRAALGGAAATEEILPGFRVNTGAQDAGMFLPEIVEKLELTNYGLEFIESPAMVFAPQLDGSTFTLWRDPARNQREIQRLSESDAENFGEFQKSHRRHLKVISSLLPLTPPDLKGGSVSDLLQWLRPGLKYKQSTRRELMELLRIIPMSIKQYLDEWFQNETLKGAIGAPAIVGSMQGPQSPGTALTVLYQTLGSSGCSRAARFVRGGIGRLSDALAKAARQFGAEIRSEAGVSAINVQEYQATGITLTSGEKIEAKVVISSATPHRTYFDLVGAPNLGPQFVRKVKNIRYRGCTAALHLALDDLPNFQGISEGHEQLSSHIQICPSLDYLERAYDDAKYGRFSQTPFLDIVIPTVLDPSLAPDGKHIMSVQVQYAPYRLAEQKWNQVRDEFSETVISTLTKYATNTRDIVIDSHLITPPDLEREYGLTEGSIYHGQMAMDQLVCMRPVAGFGRYRTPVENLYLCGAGTHPGGGVTGAPGFNAAREILKDLK
jgi:phytoene dehydrogenase-like protein